MEPGLGESQELRAVDCGTGMLIGGTEGMCRGGDAAPICDGAGEPVDERVLYVILRSSIVLRAGAAET
jgi:hypothetical protein